MSVQFAQAQVPADAEIEANSLLDLRLRVWAELGRTQMPAACVVGMSAGAIVGLDRTPDDPADIYVNGEHFGSGRLVLVDGEWAIRIESLDRPEEQLEQPSTDASAR